MARIRSIKPEFWSSEQIVECSTNARLLFVGLWTFADDGGVIPDRPIQLKMQIFPGDPFPKEQVAEWIDELVEAGLLQRFSNKSEKYLWVTGWEKHQRIDRPTLKYPGPLDEDSETCSRVLVESSSSPRSGEERIGGEGRGKDLLGDESPDTKTGSDKPDTRTEDFERLWGKRPPRAGNDPKHDARKAFNARMDEGEDLAEIENGLERYSRFVEATGKTHTEHTMRFSTFLGPAKPYKQSFNLPKTSSRNQIESRNQSAIQEAMQS